MSSRAQCQKSEPREHELARIEPRGNESVRTEPRGNEPALFEKTDPPEASATPRPKIQWSCLKNLTRRRPPRHLVPRFEGRFKKVWPAGGFRDTSSPKMKVVFETNDPPEASATAGPNK